MIVKGPWKPNDSSVRAVERHSDFSGSELVYVGDNELKDLMAHNQPG